MAIYASTAAAASAHRSSAARSTAASEINRVIQPGRSRAWCRALSNRSNSRSECTLRGYEYLGGLSVPFGTDDRRLLPDRADEARAPSSGYKAADRTAAATNINPRRRTARPQDRWTALDRRYSSSSVIRMIHARRRMRPGKGDSSDAPFLRLILPRATAPPNPLR